nr:hypothetical protein [Sinirhodobacter populi]
MVLDNEGQHGSRWQAMMSIAAKIGCAPQTLNIGPRRQKRQAAGRFQRDV